MSNEIWKDVVGFEGIYKISNFGNLKSIYRAKHIKGSLHKFGYKMVTLCNGSKRQRRTFHSIVAESYLGGRPRKHDVHHIDGNPYNNRVENLQYVSRKEHYKIDGRAGSHHGRAKLNEKIVTQCRKEYAKGSVSFRELAERHNVSNVTMICAVTGKTWKNVPAPVPSFGIVRGERHPFTSITDDTVRNIRETYASEKYSMREVANLLGIPLHIVGGVLSGNTWKHVA